MSNAEQTINDLRSQIQQVTNAWEIYQNKVERLLDNHEIVLSGVRRTIENSMLFLNNTIETLNNNSLPPSRRMEIALDHVERVRDALQRRQNTI